MLNLRSDNLFLLLDREPEQVSESPLDEVLNLKVNTAGYTLTKHYLGGEVLPWLLKLWR